MVSKILAVGFILLGIYFIWSTYRKPDPFYNQNVKGYVAGFLFILFGLMAIFGRYDVVEVLKEIGKWKSEELKAKYYR